MAGFSMAGFDGSAFRTIVVFSPPWTSVGAPGSEISAMRTLIRARASDDVAYTDRATVDRGGIDTSSTVSGALASKNCSNDAWPPGGCSGMIIR